MPNFGRRRILFFCFAMRASKTSGPVRSRSGAGRFFRCLGFVGLAAVVKPAIVQQTDLPAVLLLKSGHQLIAKPLRHRKSSSSHHAVFLAYGSGRMTVQVRIGFTGLEKILFLVPLFQLGLQSANLG